MNTHRSSRPLFHAVANFARYALPLFVLVAFTLPNGSKVWLNPRKVDAILPPIKGTAVAGARTELDVGSRAYYVIEPPDEVSATINAHAHDRED